jgi:hypothetical protein
VRVIALGKVKESLFSSLSGWVGEVAATQNSTLLKQFKILPRQLHAMRLKHCLLIFSSFELTQVRNLLSILLGSPLMVQA